MVVPGPSVGSTQMRPPWYSTIFLAMARPMPVPGYVSRACSRWKMTNTFSANSSSMPMPLSAQLTSQSSPTRATLTCTVAGTSGRRNFSELLTRLASRLTSSRSSPRTTGSSSSQVRVAFAAVRLASLCAVTSAITWSRGTSLKPEVLRPMREKASRSLMRRCMRCAPLTANAMYWSARSSSCPA